MWDCRQPQNLEKMFESFPRRWMYHSYPGFWSNPPLMETGISVVPVQGSQAAHGIYDVKQTGKSMLMWPGWLARGKGQGARIESHRTGTGNHPDKALNDTSGSLDLERLRTMWRIHRLCFANNVNLRGSDEVECSGKFKILAICVAQGRFKVLNQLTKSGAVPRRCQSSSFSTPQISAPMIRATPYNAGNLELHQSSKLFIADPAERNFIITKPVLSLIEFLARYISLQPTCKRDLIPH